MNALSFTRRQALKLIGMGSACLGMVPILSCKGNPGHIITLSFDDGFAKSSIETARIYEKYGLLASINVIAIAHEKQFELPNEYHAWPVGDFDLWNELKSRGHEIMPHTYKHADLAVLPLEEAIVLMTKCFEVFLEKLEGFKTTECIYNFAFNSSTPELENWLSARVRAFRTGGGAVNPYPYRDQQRLTCTSHGPENIDARLEQTINEFLEGPSGWMIYNAHGLDNEGWGPVSSSCLDELLDRISSIPGVGVLSVTQALDLAGR
jgi:peptidoglycan/xylan/chitin deacetylase (PgdA/CDA1 family)